MAAREEERRLTVLWATDGSARAEAAVPLLDRFLGPHIRRLYILTVAPQPILTSGDRPDPSTILWHWLPSWRDRAAELATQIVTEAAALIPDRIPAETLVRLGSPTYQILEAAREVGADLIVVGEQGHGAVGRALLGSVAFNVVRQAACSVLVARPPRPEVRRLLVATDGSPHGEAAVEAAAALAPADGEVVVLSVVAPVTLPFSGLPEAGAVTGYRWLEEAEEGERQAAEAVTERAAAELRARGAAARPEVRRGDVASTVVQAAEDLGADVVLVGSRGRSAVSSLLLGSVAGAVVDRAPCSVLVVRRPSPPEER
ncbi:MAG TPA: universal stress protein [Dehalococcoidia bacterium]